MSSEHGRRGTTTLFVSDLHLDDARPRITALFLRFLREEAVRAEALYILGDLFEAWIGDDDASQAGAEVAPGLRAVADAGVKLAFLHGNRDFLLGHDYAARAGLRLLPDPVVVDLYGTPTLLGHGDLLCTQDHAYQAFRRQTRDPAWRARFLAQPLEARLAFARQAREASRAHLDRVEGGRARPDGGITDVDPGTVASTFARFGVDRMIHGHTHRPAVHTLEVGDRTCTRIVLGDWYEQGSVLRVDAGGLRLSALG